MYSDNYAAWQNHEKNLCEWKQEVLKYKWNILLTIRKHCDSENALWNQTSTGGYSNRNNWTNRVIQGLRCNLKLNKKQLHYLYVHEFGPVYKAHTHALIQITKPLDHQFIYDALRETSAAFYKISRVKVFYTKADSKTKLSRRVFIAEQKSAVDYILKIEDKVNHKGLPISKEVMGSAYLKRYGINKNLYVVPKEPSPRQVVLHSWQSASNYLNYSALNSEVNVKRCVFYKKLPDIELINSLRKEDIRKGIILEELLRRRQKAIPIVELNSEALCLVKELEHRDILKIGYLQEYDEDPVVYESPKNPYERPSWSLRENLSYILNPDSRKRVISSMDIY